MMKTSKKRHHYITPILAYRPQADHFFAWADFEPLPEDTEWECAIAARQTHKGTWSLYRYVRAIADGPDGEWEFDFEKLPITFSSADMSEMLSQWTDLDEQDYALYAGPEAWRDNIYAPKDYVFQVRRTDSPEPDAKIVEHRNKTKLIVVHEWEKALARGEFTTKSYKHSGAENHVGFIELPKIKNSEDYDTMLSLQVKDHRLELTRHFRVSAAPASTPWRTQTLDVGAEEELFQALASMQHWCRAAQTHGQGAIDSSIFPNAKMIGPHTSLP